MGSSDDTSDEAQAVHRRDVLIVDIVGAIAERQGVDPLDLPPLMRFVDLDAVEAVVASVPDERRTDLTVAFDYDGVPVRVHGDGSVTVGADGDGPDARGDRQGGG